MPHPERAIEKLLGSIDGINMLKGFYNKEIFLFCKKKNEKTFYLIILLNIFLSINLFAAKIYIFLIKSSKSNIQKSK